MAFLPKAGDTLVIDQVEFRFAAHPAAEGMPYGQEGRAAVVFQLVSEQGTRQGTSALKVFKPRFRRPSLVAQSDRIARFATLAGMTACTRTVITSRRYADLLQEHPDLTYSVVMPWIDGPTWTEVLLDKGGLSREDSLRCARTLAEILAGLEEQGLAHCDLSGPNVLIPALATPAAPDHLQAVELVDMEQIYGPGLENPEVLLSGSGGYSPRYGDRNELWTQKADRFAGALLIVEMLGWCDAAVREASWGESYFDPDEIQQPDSTRYKTLIEALQRQWGSRPADLFADVWRSETMDDCPTFGEWVVKLPRLASLPPQSATVATPAAAAPTPIISINTLVERAGQLEAQGNLAGALESYKQAFQGAPRGSGLAQELALIVANLEGQLGNLTQAVTPSPVAAAPAPAPAPAPARAPEAPKELTELDRIFNFGLSAYERGEWRAAQEMFRAVVNTQPGYTIDGKSAAALLADVDRRIAAQSEQARAVAPAQVPPAGATTTPTPATTTPAAPTTAPIAAAPQTGQPAAAVSGGAGAAGPQQVEQPNWVAESASSANDNRYSPPDQPPVYAQQPQYSAQPQQPYSQQPYPQQPYPQQPYPQQPYPQQAPAPPAQRSGVSPALIFVGGLLLAIVACVGSVYFFILRPVGTALNDFGSSLAATATAIEGELGGTDPFDPFDGQSGPTVVPVERVLSTDAPLTFTYANLEFAVTKGVITNAARSNPDEADLNLSFSVTNPTAQYISVDAGLLQLKLPNGDVYQQTFFQGIDGRDTQEFDISFTVPLSTTWEGAQLTLDQIDKHPATLVLDGPPQPSEYPRILPAVEAVDLARPQMRYEVTEGFIDLDAMGNRAPLDKLYLVLTVVVSNNKPQANDFVGSESFGLIVDGTPLRADRLFPAAEAIDPQKSAEFQMAFLIPTDASQAELEFGEASEESGKTPLDLQGATP